MIPKFSNQSLLDRALTHRSALNEGISPVDQSNERLEFLGDAVLELATTEFLFNKLPHEQEGTLTAFRSALVRTRTLAGVARTIGLGELLYMSKGEEAGGGRKNDSLLENSMEALIGAIYLDQGYEPARDFLTEHLFPEFETIQEENLHIDSKSHLQEIVQAQGKAAPTYTIVKHSGPDHDRTFVAEVLVSDEPLGRGEGKSKREAQQAAAQAALDSLDSKT